MLPPVASAQSGVFVDPDSPAGKEYAIPLEEARREASGGSGGANRLAERGAAEPPRFGVGIEGPGAAGPDQAPSAGGSDGASAPDRRVQPGDVAGNREGPAALTAAASDGSSMGPTAVVIAAVLAAALLGGIALRRVLRDDGR